MKTIRDQVQEFHAKFNVPYLGKPGVPSFERVCLRLNLIREEFYELLSACHADNSECFGVITMSVKHQEFRNRDLPAIADALADLDYVIEGMRQEFGIDGRPIADLVHASNMAKEGGGERADGKICKPPGWQAPDIAGELRKQGWEG